MAVSRASTTPPGVARLSPWATPTDVEAYADEALAGLIDEQVNQHAIDRDETCTAIPREVFVHLAGLGILGYLIPRAGGGLGGSRRVFGLLLEQVGYLSQDLSLATMLAMYADVPNVVYRSRNPALLDAYVRPMAAGEKLGTFAYTDEGDAFDFRTRVVRHGDRWVLTGVKCLQTGGAHADVFVTYARDEADDMRVLLVDRNDAGVRTTPVRTLGLRSAGLTRLELDDVVLGPERDLSGSDGLADAQMFLNSRRMFLVCPLVGALRQVIDVCVRHLDTVIREGRPLTGAQAVQAGLGMMYARYLTSRAVLHDALGRLGRGAIDDMFDPFISAAKYIITENVMDACERAIRLTGWRGQSHELPLQLIYRSSMAALAGQTPQDLLEINLGVIATTRVQLFDEIGRRS
jgi:hypothetical protein